MNAERWQRVRAVLERALEVPVPERAALLQRECGDDPELRREVAELLAVDGTGRFEPPRESELRAAFAGGTPARVVGGYVLKRELGCGGMGTVYLARREVDGFVQHVALKLVRRGLDEAETIRRFHTERAVLAALQHDRIARFLDGGATPDGQPWYAMEYVDGEMIDRWCDDHELGTKARVGLFLEVCEAVQHAHAKLVVHRDLKPANLLVAGDGHVKLLDFGIAKLLESDAAETLAGQRALTPAYASPEQLRGEPITIASDIYSMGVVLYELLTGVRPFASPTALIARPEPERPSTAVHRTAKPGQGGRGERLARELRGDLDTILLKTLHPDPDRRYATAAALADDLQRHLAGRMVLARPDTTGYRLRTFVRRNRLAVGLAASVLVTLVAGLASTLSMYRSAERSAERERRRADEVMRLSALQRLEDLTVEADRLWPAVPENLPRYEKWLEKAAALVAELPDHEKKLSELRRQSVPWTAAEQSEPLAEHPLSAELERAKRHRDHLETLRAALESGPPSSDPIPAGVGVDLASLSAAANDVNDLAWPLIDPDRSDWGGEAKGLVLARHALALGGDLPPAERARIRDSLAWALFANGRFDEAAAEEELALEEAAAGEKAHFQGYAAKLKDRIEAEIDPERRVERAQRGTEIEQEIAALEAQIARPPEWRFPDTQDKWWHNQLEKLVDGLKAFADESTGLFSAGISPERGWAMKKRLDLARSLSDGFVVGGAHAAAWSEALPEIRAAYPGLALTPQVGLLPLGPDPDSGLWEFAHLATGAPAVRGPDGKLVLKEETGLVLVLLPGGTFRMGAQRSDPLGPNYDPAARGDEGPVRAVTLSPFFLSKHEMTQGQWLRFTGKNPSNYTPGNLARSWMNPVEQTSWDSCVEVLGRLGLQLPSEAQWEYGARGGTTSVWWTGDERDSLLGAANLADQAAKRAGADWQEIDDWPELDDGYPVHAPVNEFEPNAFGLFSVLGNVWEWCLDGYDGDSYAQPATRDPVSDPAGSAHRVYRGGGFYVAASNARSAFRYYAAPPFASDDLGVRPARGITP